MAKTNPGGKIRPAITLAREPRTLTHDQALRKLRLKPSDVLAERDAGSEFIFVTKNGMKIRVKKT